MDTRTNRLRIGASAYLSGLSRRSLRTDLTEVVGP